ncbi:MAG: hypothetical protein ABL925_02565 [Methylococcales bacterium]
MFVNTLPIIFAYTQLFNGLEMFLFLSTIFFLAYYNAPPINPYWHGQPVSGIYYFLRSSWQGEASLWRAFWPFFIFVNVVFFYIDYRVMNVTYTIASWKTVHGMLFLPVIWWTTSVWRCSVNTQHRVWAGAARTVTIYLFLELFLRFIISTRYPNTFFDCRLLVMEFGDCL